MPIESPISDKMHMQPLRIGACTLAVFGQLAWGDVQSSADIAVEDPISLVGNTAYAARARSVTPTTLMQG